MEVKILDIQNGFLSIKGSAAELTIARTHDRRIVEWLVNWKINHSLDTCVSGKTLFSSENLVRAFNLIIFINPEHDSGEWLIKRYGGTEAKQGRFIRYRDHLNIPGPGTGSDGDPNISIKLNQKIKDAVGSLISQ